MFRLNQGYKLMWRGNITGLEKFGVIIPEMIIYFTACDIKTPGYGL